MLNPNTVAPIKSSDYDSPDFPYDLPADLPADYSYPREEEEVDEPICDCHYCIMLSPCDFVKKILREEGYTVETDWRLA